VAKADKSMAGVMVGVDKGIFEHQSEITEMNKALLENRPEDALTIYAGLPAGVQREKTIFLIRISALGKLRKVRTEEYHQALAEYEKAFPGDPSKDLVCLDVWLSAKDFANCYNAIDRLEKWSGGDPLLDAIRGNVMLIEDKPGAAARVEKLARAAVESEPRLTLPHEVLVRALARQKRFDEAVAALRTIETRIQKRLKVEDLADLKEFVASEAYKRYRGMR
jgi:predicted Zn-dependent protease